MNFRGCTPYKDDNAIMGFFSDGTKVANYWGNLDSHPGIASSLGLTVVCPDFGTEACLECEYGLLRPLEACDCKCLSCAESERCPCTRVAWMERQGENAQRN